MAAREVSGYDPLMLLLGFVACAEDPRDPLLPPTPPPCEDPGHDTVVLPGVPDASRRFLGAGPVVADVDRNGVLDLLLPGPHEVRLLRGPDFAPAPEAIPDRDYTDTVGGAAADVDGDGDLDVVLTRFGPPDVLLLNRGDGTFDDATDPVLGRPGHSQSAAWADVDGDGDLDLAIAGHGPVDDSTDRVIIEGPADPTRLLLNRGDGTFDDATDRVPQRMQDAYTFVVTFSDLDGDRLPDLYQANDWPIFEVGLAALNRVDSLVLAPELGLDLHAAGMGIGAADVDGDELDDFLIPIWDQIVFLRSSGGRWIDATAAAGLRLPPRDEPWVGWGAEWGDLDNDTDLDALVVFGRLDTLTPLTPGGGTTANAERQRDLVFERLGTAEFQEVGAAWGLDDDGAGRGVVLADLNGDGALDVVRRDLSGPTRVDLSRCAPASWLVVRPEPPARAGGARVVVEAAGERLTRTVRAGGTGLAGSGPPEVHFGLGHAEAANRVEVHWPDGDVTALDFVGARQVLEVR